jgi:hypothetical protein
MGPGLTAFDSYHTNKELVWDCLQFSPKLAEQKMLGHNGIEGKEIVDSLVK